MKSIIIAIALTAATLTTAHAGYVCEKPGGGKIIQGTPCRANHKTVKAITATPKRKQHKTVTIETRGMSYENIFRTLPRVRRELLKRGLDSAANGCEVFFRLTKHDSAKARLDCFIHALNTGNINKYIYRNR